jgi:hypothetical protein
MAQVRLYSQGNGVQETSAVDALVFSIRRLVSHRAFRRDGVTSPALKRHLPFVSGYGVAFDERDLRRRLEQAKLDARTIAYLRTACDDQLDVLRKGAD